MLVTAAASARFATSPRRRMPPRAVSNTATSTRLSRSTARAPSGPDKSPRSITPPPTSLQSVDGSRDRQARAARKEPHRRFLSRPPHGVEHPPGLLPPRRDGRRGFFGLERDLDDRSGAVEQQVRAGQPAGLEELHRAGISIPG